MKIPMLKDMTSCTTYQYVGEDYTVEVVERQAMSPVYTISFSRANHMQVVRTADSLFACNFTIRELIEEAFDVKPDTETVWWDR